MRMTLLKISSAILCTAVVMNSAVAGYSSSATPAAPPSGTSGGYESSSSGTVITQTNVSPSSSYSSSVSAPPSTAVVDHHHKKHNRFSVSLNIPGTNTVVSYRESKHGKIRIHQGPFWIHMESGEPMPANAVIGGNQYHPNSLFHVCRANYRGGVHPGKLYNGNCNISWGGQEYIMTNYEVLVSDKPMSWVGSSYGRIPQHAIAAGSENGAALYACQAQYQNGTHTGKVIGQNCNFGWGGKEISVPYYNVLVG
ncbi:MAG TPA: DUF3421 domain-containing protein [Gammaproteobacteria bacterium]|jgi:hypothetical protein|nr:DUF3421 domain-containing protein [Gammaproteobacteria bacterium]